MLKLTDYKGLGNAEYSDTLIGLRLSTRLHIGGKAGPSYIDVLLSGVSPLALTNALGLNYIKALGATEQRNLPSEYTQVEYLQSTGEEYINTGISGDVRWVITAQGNAVQSSSQVLICSSGAAAGATWYGVYTRSEYWGFGAQYSTVPLTTKATADLVFNSSGVSGTVNGQEISRDVSATQGDWTIFASSTLSYPFACKLFDAKIYQDGVLVRNFIPAKNSSNEVGLYDTVTGNFFTNAGTGTFTAGADVVPTPDNPVDIVCNNGVLNYGYKSVNMFDKNSTLEDGEVWAGGGAIINLQGYYGTNQIHVIGGHTYTRSGSHGSANYIKLSNGTWKLQSDNSATITMPDNAVLWLFNNTTTTSRDTMMVVEGTSLPAEYVPYKGYGIYADGTQETVTVAGENLFDKNTVVTGYRLTNLFGKKYGNIGVDFTWADDSFVSALIPVEVGKIYTKNSPEQDAYHRFKVYDKDQNAVRITNANSITIGSGEAYIAITGYLTELDDTILRDNTINVQTANAEMLLKVGDYQDNQELLTGNITRNVGIIVLDGSEENWDNSAGSTLTDYRIFRNTSFFPSALPTPQPWFVTHFTTSNSNIYNVANQATRFGGKGGQILICISESALGIDATATETQAIDAWKQYLATQYANGTPVIVVYPTSSPVTETVTGQSLTAIGNCTVTATGSLDNLSLEVSYKQGVMLRVQETENENLDNQVNVTVS